MPLTRQQREELDELLFALRDAALDAAGHARLERLVLEHPEAQEQFVVTMCLQASLHWKFADQPAVAPVPASVPGSHRRTPSWWWAAAAAVLVNCGVLGYLALQHISDGQALARVTKVLGASFKEGAMAEGTALAPGRRLELAAGLVEITFASGARVVLEGPASFEVLSQARSRLATGALTARVPPQLRGFAVEAPGLTVVDLGTEFGVRTSEAGVSEVHVFDGAVEAVATKGAARTVRLSEGQAIQCDGKSGALEDVLFDEERFVRDLYRAPAAPAAAPEFAEGFDSLTHLQLQQGYKCPVARTSISADCRSGTGAVRIDWQAAPDNYGVVYLARKVAATDITGRSFSVWVKPLNASSGYWGIELFDDRGELVEQHRVFDLKVNQWNRLVFQQGKKSRGYFHAGSGDRTRVCKVVFRAQTHKEGQAASDLWDDLQLK
jgi:ferric-dicitrate binding protein FerR (iron transport regulator)